LTIESGLKVRLRELRAIGVVITKPVEQVLVGGDEERPATRSGVNQSESLLLELGRVLTLEERAKRFLQM